MPSSRESARAELERIASGKAASTQRAFARAIGTPKTREAHRRVARAFGSRSLYQAYDTAAVQAIEAPPCWLPPTG